MRWRDSLALVEREQKGEGNSLGGEVCLDIGRRFTELHMTGKGLVKRLDARRVSKPRLLVAQGSGGTCAF